jgi:hypothetical protein
MICKTNVTNNANIKTNNCNNIVLFSYLVCKVGGDQKLITTDIHWHSLQIYTHNTIQIKTNNTKK